MEKINIFTSFISFFDDLLMINDTKPVNDAQEVYDDNKG